jgi:predicted nucleic acid-binding protein
MIVVLDASAAVGFVLGRSDHARIRGGIDSAEEVHVPQLYVAELSNSFWKYHRLEGLDLDTCQKAVDRGLLLPDRFWDDRELRREALAMACACGTPVYDMFYLVLARRLGAHLATADRELRKLAGRHDVRVL